MKKTIAFIVQLIILLIICKLGYFIAHLLHLPIPGNVIGMILLFSLLQTKVLKVEWIELTSGFLVKHLAFFFIPISISLMTMGWLFIEFGLPLALTLGVSLIFGFIVSAWTVQKLSHRGEVKQHDSAHHNL
ncbi:CidA/LrgA family protein [Peribacillus sp. NJ4]|uniref:CidA/LrgA family protein n=1 Tax=Peribacillus TaxID=2675229 RepID=UPI0025A11F14|nr:MULTISPECIES: CidA/LrgA family protein [unclassified Peribacillus]MDM5212167.1 CidA/LrgA family protein [Peribacillus sp. NJ4]MDM5222490.1 CidA/LrgA family protein [Peribacillus sp. NJ11]